MEENLAKVKLDNREAKDSHIQKARICPSSSFRGCFAYTSKGDIESSKRSKFFLNDFRKVEIKVYPYEDIISKKGI